MHLVEQYRRMVHNAFYASGLYPTITFGDGREQLIEILHTVAKEEFGLKRVAWPEHSSKSTSGLAWGGVGWYAINPNADDIRRVPHTIMHEIAHCLYKHGNDSATRWQHEIQAESVAYLVELTLGTDYSNHSSCYIHHLRYRQATKALAFALKTEPTVMEKTSLLVKAIQNVA